MAASSLRELLVLKGAVSRTLSLQSAVHFRSLTTTPTISAGSKWRYEQGKAANNSSYGPLTDLPDYTYLDGRPTELSTCQTRRRQARIDTASRVMRLISEIKLGQDTYRNKLELEAKQKEEILQKKLKPKPKYINKKK